MAYNIYDRNKLRNKSAVYNAELVEPRVNADNIVFNTDNVPPSPKPQPVVDTRNSIVSLATLLGPTPEEREAQQRKLQGHKSKMAAWTGLFDGLRNLGNLYAVSKGATPQQYSNPYKAVDQQATEAQQWLDNIQRNRQNYAMMLHNLQRQGDQDEMRRQAHEAQLKWYDTRDEMARLKADNDKLKTEKYIELQDGRIAKVNAETGKLLEMLPYQINEVESRTRKNDRTGGGGRGGSRTSSNYGYKIVKHRDPESGDIITTRTPATAPVENKNGKRRGKSGVNTKILSNFSIHN